MPQLNRIGRRSAALRPTLPPTSDDAITSFARAVADRIVLMPIAELKSFQRRSRTHTDEQIARIMGSFGAFGFLTPIVIDEKNYILAGHARVEAARRLSYAAVPAVIASHLTADEKRAFVIADNRLPNVPDGIKRSWRSS